MRTSQNTTCFITWGIILLLFLNTAGKLCCVNHSVSLFHCECMLVGLEEKFITDTIGFVILGEKITDCYSNITHKNSSQFYMSMYNAHILIL